jgi:inorganic pyrophosphatase
MSGFLDRLSPTAESGLVNIVIDTPKGSRNKFKYDQKTQCFRLSRVLPAGACFPYDFGSIPMTLAEDGDALDVLVISDTPSFTGCVITGKLIGTISGKQTEKKRPYVMTGSSPSP